MPRQILPVVLLAIVVTVVVLVLRPSTSSSAVMKFNGNHILASENMVLHTPEEVEVKFLDMLLDLDVTTISFNVYPENFEAKKALYDELVQRIRSSGKGLILVYMVSSKTFKETPSFEEYLRKEVEYAERMVKRYKPDYFGIVVEPTTMQKRIGTSFSLDQWVELVDRVNSVVKRISPGTKTFVSLLPAEASGVPRLVKTGVDAVAFNVWGRDKAEKIAKWLDYIRSHGKEAWIWENWWSTQHIPNFRSCRNQELDSEWITFIYKLAKEHHATMISPYFTEQFVFCANGTMSSQEMMEALFRSVLEGKRTQAFWTYREIIVGGRKAQD